MINSSFGNAFNCSPALSLSKFISPVKKMADHKCHSSKADNGFAGDEYHFKIYHNIAELPTFWDELTNGGNFFLQRAYLQLLESYPPEGLSFSYILFFKKEKAVGLAVCQLLPFNAADSINGHEKNIKEGGILENCLKPKIASRVKFTALICGNLMLTGENAFHFIPGEVEDNTSSQLLLKALDTLRDDLGEKGISVDGILMKDFLTTNKPFFKPFFGNRYKTFTYQPNMVLKVRSEWLQFEDYIKAKSSKYRVRYRRAQKKAEGLRRQVLSLEEIALHTEKIYQLYCKVADSASFNLCLLHPDYFIEMKRRFPNDFQLFAYFDEEVLVGFFTTIRNGECLDAHFLGFDAAYNPTHQLYLNMLYRIIHLGIEQGVSEISFSRTALEIKSSVGAKPQEMQVYFRHNNPLLNSVLPIVSRFLEPQQALKQRNPFKKLPKEE